MDEDLFARVGASIIKGEVDVAARITENALRVRESTRFASLLTSGFTNTPRSVTTITNYLETNRSRMKYDEYLLAGLPIATGFIEGACRHVIKDRLERTGMRWTRKGAQTMLTMRCIDASKLWRPLMEKYRAKTLDYPGGRKNYFDLICTAA